MKTIYLIIFLFTGIATKAIAQHYFFGGNNIGGKQDDIGNYMVRDHLGYYYIVGTFRDTLKIGAGSNTTALIAEGGTDAFVSKWGLGMQLVWAARIGGLGNDNGYGVAVDNMRNVYIGGSFEGTADFDPSASTYPLTSKGLGDGFVAKLDTIGNFVWARKIGGNEEDEVRALTVDKTNNLYSTGYFNDTAEIELTSSNLHFVSEGQEDFFILKQDSLGNILWVHSFGSTGQDFGRSIAIDSGSNVLATGAFEDTVDFDPSPLVSNLSSFGEADIFILKLNSTGNLIWAKNIGGLGKDQGNCVATDPLDGALYTTGYFHDTADFDPSSTSNYLLSSGGKEDAFVSKLSNAGNFLWALHYKGGNTSIGNFVSVDTHRNVYTTGYFLDTIELSTDPQSYHHQAVALAAEDAYITRITSYGTRDWAYQLGTMGNDRGNAVYGRISIPTKYIIYAMGSFEDSLDFGAYLFGYTLTSFGKEDIYTFVLGEGLGLSSPNRPQFRLFPNPTGQAVKIDFGKYVEDATVKLYNSLGQELCIKKAKKTQYLDMPIIGAPGLYLLQIIENDNRSMLKVLKQ